MNSEPTTLETYEISPRFRQSLEERIVRLEQNYRSTQIILEAAGAVVANNLRRKGKKLSGRYRSAPATPIGVPACSIDGAPGPSTCVMSAPTRPRGCISRTMPAIGRCSARSGCSEGRPTTFSRPCGT